jgi:hypothetical protein
VGRRAGAYRFSVWVRNSGSSAPYDTFTAFPYTLTSTPCTTATATAAPATGAALGSTVTISGSAATCPNPQFQFYVLAPGGVWQIAQPYSASASMTWSTAGKPAGTYRISVWARDTSSAAAYDAFQAFDYTLTLEPCTGVTTTVTPAATAARGTTVSLSAVATGCPNPLYELWVLGPGGVWTIARSYSPVATLTWSTTGRAAGTYRFSVWARDAGSGASYDTFQAFDYGLT